MSVDLLCTGILRRGMMYECSLTVYRYIKKRHDV